jgi:predicted Zn-dependent peptidase
VASVPIVRVSVSFDAGNAADAPDSRGLQALMLNLLDEGTTSRNSVQIAEAGERLGASISSSASLDRTSVGLFALKPNLAPSLDLLADIVRNPAFDPKEVERVRAQQLAGIAARLSDPEGIAHSVLPGILYGTAHPYAASGIGDAAVVGKLTRESILRFYKDWIRPGNAQIFVVGDSSLAAIKPLLEARFGTWAEPEGPHPAKAFPASVPAPQPRIILINRANAPQSVVIAGEVLAHTGKDDLAALRTGNDVLGGSFLSRINTDLRETKGWSYGASSQISATEGPISFSINAPVQTDRTGDAIKAIMAQNNAFFGAKGVTGEELDRSVNGTVRALPGDFDSTGAILGALQRIVWLGRPDDYYDRLPQKFRALTTPLVDATARATIDPAKLVYIVVGDAAKVRPQLDGIGLAVESMTLPKAP